MSQLPRKWTSAGVDVVYPAYPKPRAPMLPTLSLEFMSGASSSPYSSAFSAGKTTWCARGCDALALILTQACPDTSRNILVPALHCPSITETLKRFGYSATFYPINEDLTPVEHAIRLGLLGGAQAVLLIHYFGFIQDAVRCRDLCDSHGAVLIEDCAHAYFGIAGEARPGDIGHFAIASPRKFFPLPDGGAAISNHGLLDNSALTPVGWAEEGRTILRAAQQAADFGRLGMLSAPLSTILHALDRLRATTPTQTQTPSPERPSQENRDRVVKGASRTSRRLLAMTNVDRLAVLRRRNYIALLEGLRDLRGGYALFPELPREVVPYVFPLVLSDPDRMFPDLKRRRVPLFRWEGIAGLGCTVSDSYTSTLIQLPCHQELRPDDVSWIIDQLHAALGTKA